MTSAICKRFVIDGESRLLPAKSQIFVANRLNSTNFGTHFPIAEPRGFGLIGLTAQTLANIEQTKANFRNDSLVESLLEGIDGNV